MKQRVAAIAVAALLVLSCAAFAQNSMRGLKNAGRNQSMGSIAKQLNLSSDQVKSITEIVQKYHADVRDVAKSSATKDEKQSKIKALMQSANQAIMDVLNTEQQAKAKQTKLVDNLLNRRPGQPLHAILAKLDLTDQQKTAVKSIMKDGADQAKAVRQDTTLTPADRQAKCKEIRANTIGKIKEQLTVDQLKKFNDMMQQMQSRKQK
jgi:hypothetical protein